MSISNEIKMPDEEVGSRSGTDFPRPPQTQQMSVISVNKHSQDPLEPGRCST